jgi:hypothetical protein
VDLEAFVAARKPRGREDEHEPNIDGPLRRSGKLRMLLGDEFLTPLRYYK